MLTEKSANNLLALIRCELCRANINPPLFPSHPKFSLPPSLISRAGLAELPLSTSFACNSHFGVPTILCAMQSLDHLAIEHLQPLRRALINFLSAPISEFTYAQIIDGMPTSDVYATDHNFRDGLAVSDHEELCPGSIEKARAFRADFNVLDLVFKSKVSISEGKFTDFHNLMT